MEKANIHGCLVVWAGRGILLVGESGVGKTSCALEISRRGGAWVADDLVIVTTDQDGFATGYPHEKIRNLAYLRSEGIIDVRAFPHVTSIVPETRIAVVVELIKILEKKRRKYLTVRQKLENAGWRAHFASVRVDDEAGRTAARIIGCVRRLTETDGVAI